jgi:hypothetical protein
MQRRRAIRSKSSPKTAPGFSLLSLTRITAGTFTSNKAMVQNQGCVLTGFEAKDFSYVGNTFSLVTYHNAAVGQVLIGEMFYQELVNLRKTSNPVLAGYCRQEHEAGRKPMVLRHGSIEELEMTLKYPKTLKERSAYLMKHLYDKGGKDGGKFILQNWTDYPLCFCEGPKSFDAVVEHLVDRTFVECQTTNLPGEHKRHKIRLTAVALDSMEGHLAQGPMLGLTSQEIATSDPEWDKRIQHAMELFNEQPRTKERMRLAVVELHAVMEPLRDKLASRFSKGDTQTFFELVNRFDVRHNKEQTMRIEHEEQLEWLYYSFLNTLNTFTKLERKLAGNGAPQPA